MGKGIRNSICDIFTTSPTVPLLRATSSHAISAHMITVRLSTASNHSSFSSFFARSFRHLMRRLLRRVRVPWVVLVLVGYKPCVSVSGSEGFVAGVAERNVLLASTPAKELMPYAMMRPKDLHISRTSSTIHLLSVPSSSLRVFLCDRGWVEAYQQ